MATRYGFTECCDTACMAHGVSARHSYDALGRRTAIARSGSAMTESRSDAYGYLCVQRLDAANDNDVNLLVVWDPTEPVATRPLFMMQPGGQIEPKVYEYGFLKK